MESAAALAQAKQESGRGIASMAGTARVKLSGMGGKAAGKETKSPVRFPSSIIKKDLALMS